ncbi:MAG TPA: GspH/FimT family pseudopilin [Candidatus Acidoferrum sp.]|nr:GspH/FimT family pseudopilin [Candidatus Acidoferrum sp.]
MKHSTKTTREQRGARGFTTVELVVVTAVILVMSAVALPSFWQMYQSYQLTDAAHRVANSLKFARFEAVRRNQALNWMMTRSNTTPATISTWTDSNGNGVLDQSENQTIFVGNVGPIQAASAPHTSALATGIGANVVLTGVSPPTATIGFDRRGGVNPPAVYAVYLANGSVARVGYRAVILLPSGSVQVWTADSTGNWQQLD